MKKKIIIPIVGILALVLGTGWYLYRAQTPASDWGTTVDPNDTQAIPGLEITLKDIGALENLEIDTSIFSDSVFQSLEKYAIGTSSQEQIGRANPFIAF